MPRLRDYIPMMPRWDRGYSILALPALALGFAMLAWTLGVIERILQ